MTREKEIAKAANEAYTNAFISNVFDFGSGARWADEHPQSPWISVEKQQPKVGDEIILKTFYGYNRYVSRLENKLWDFMKQNREIYTHWMPIPELPKGGEG